MSLQEFFKRMNTEHKPPQPTKRLCTESLGVQAHLRMETATNAHQERQCGNEPSNIDSECQESTSSTSAITSWSTSSKQSDCQESTSSTSAIISGSTSSKQSRRFRKALLTGRERWLEYSRHDRGMFCSLCQKFNKRPFNNNIWNKQPCT